MVPLYIKIILTKLSLYDAQKKYNEFMKNNNDYISKHEGNKDVDEGNKNDYSKGSEVRSSDKTDY